MDIQADIDANIEVMEAKQDQERGEKDDSEHRPPARGRLPNQRR